MKLHEIKKASGTEKDRKRIGRGQGSGRGGTSTRGHKGQQSRSGYSSRAWFEGGQMPLQRRIPKFGFKNHFRVAYRPVNLDTLQQLAEANNVSEIDHKFLVDHGIISSDRKLVKVLGRGELSTALTVKLNKFSQSARKAIESAGGEAVEV